MSQDPFRIQDRRRARQARAMRSVFDFPVVSNYDIMNDLMSAGLHRLWKAYTIQIANPRLGDRKCSTSPAAPRPRPGLRAQGRA